MMDLKSGSKSNTRVSASGFCVLGKILMNSCCLETNVCVSVFLPVSLYYVVLSFCPSGEDKRDTDVSSCVSAKNKDILSVHTAAHRTLHALISHDAL